jgi:hypothetical protein
MGDTLEAFNTAVEAGGTCFCAGADKRGNIGRASHERV